MSFWAKPAGRIFINYRRDDEPGVAGRLADALGNYFGDGRVFRDVDGIDAGANFEDVLQRTTHSADAMIVLIGRRWLAAVDAQGQSRLHRPDDWVAREIAAALGAKIPIFPVLVENATMPRADELPAPLQALARHNAIALSDHRWHADVTRLAKVVAIDLPASAAQRTLDALRVAISCALFAAVALTTGVVCWYWYNGLGAQPLALAWLGVTFVVVVGASMLLLFFANLVDPPKRRWIYAAALAGLMGTLACFLAFLPLDPGLHESAAMVFGGTVTAMLVLILMNQSGFKAR